METETPSPSSIQEALERAVALHAEVMSQVEQLLGDEDCVIYEDAPSPQ